MSFKKIILFGSSGLLGAEFKKIFEAKKFDFSAPSSVEVNVLHFEKTQEFVKKGDFDLIVYCVAYTKVDKAEIEPEKCQKLNVFALKNLTGLKIPIIHFSSDYVFSAPENMEIPENFPQNPINFYGKTKAMAEEVLEKSQIPYWNIRTNWLFGATGSNFVTTILNLARKLEKEDQNQKIKIVSDQIGRPTFSKDLAEFVVKNFIETAQNPGHYHLQNTGDLVSWADFAEYFLKKCGKLVEIERISSEEFFSLAKRPKNSVLKNTKLPDSLRNWKDAIDAYCNQN